MAKALDKATADGCNVDAGLKAIGITNQRETTVSGANPQAFRSTMQLCGWMLAQAPFAGLLFVHLPFFC